MVKYRKFITPAVGFCFVVVGTTGVIFKVFFKNHVMEEIHGWLGLALVLAATGHIFLNWSQLRAHFRDRRVFALVLPVLAVIAFFALGPQEEKRKTSSRLVIHRLSRASAGDVARALGTQLDFVVKSMSDDGLHVKNAEVSVDAIAQENGTEPEVILGYFLKQQERN
jgi:hypothetical protein